VDFVFIGSGWWLLFDFYIITFLLRTFVLVQHYDKRGQFEIALSKIDEAIEHTPTVIDLYSVKVCWSYKLFSFLSSSFCCIVNHPQLKSYPSIYNSATCLI